MYMLDAKMLRWHPTQPIFHRLASGFGVGANANSRFGVGGLASGNANFHIIDTNMLVILALGDAEALFFVLGDAKVLFFALGDAKIPDATYFVFWWNIGFSLIN